MTRRILRSIVLSAVVALAASSSSLFASETRVATVTVPFAFRAGSQTMPAGVYQISKSEQSVLFLRTAGKCVALLTVGAASATPSGANLVRFERVDGQNVIKEVLVDGGQGFLVKR